MAISSSVYVGFIPNHTYFSFLFGDRSKKINTTPTKTTILHTAPEGPWLPVLFFS